MTSTSDEFQEIKLQGRENYTVVAGRKMPNWNLIISLFQKLRAAFDSIEARIASGPGGSGSGNIDGGDPETNYGGIVPIDGGIV